MLVAIVKMGVKDSFYAEGALIQSNEDCKAGSISCRIRPLRNSYIHTCIHVEIFTDIIIDNIKDAFVFLITYIPNWSLEQLVLELEIKWQSKVTKKFAP